MMKRNKHHTCTSTAVDMHYVGGSGGSRAFLAGSGSLLALYAAGYSNNWQSMGGVSGGSIATLLFTGGVPAPRIVESAVDLDFTTLVSQKSTIPHFVRTKVRRKRNREPLSQGFVSTEGLGLFLEGLVSDWPANYWTLAVAGSSQILFTADGVFEYTADGRCVQLSSVPAPVGLAVRASCAVPGVLEAVRFLGRDLFDGAISRDGRCPVELVRRHFAATPDNIVALEISGRVSSHTWFNGIGEFYARYVSGSFRQRALRPEGASPGANAGVYVHPTIDGFTSLQFSLTREQKETAVLQSFRQTVNELAIKGLVPSDRLGKMLEASGSYDDLKRLYLTPEPVIAHRKRWQRWRRNKRSAVSTEVSQEARPSWT